MFLKDVHIGGKVRITTMNRMNDLVQRRLLDLGIMEGSVVKMKRILPLGGPVAIETKGQLIGIRRCDAKRIQVESV
ncbi:ferrous iron transport protein A [Cytobacillus depressus]|uniref:Ferrous iron transport protein A n=1 Tax=Cytobacillus depressus TaxID=1602942 RepID=A0A6L3V2X0_9BACI|nr:FeoA family protein [Cytobacillus depressus]KAB2333308.1 ferrous iron transport protein A [Cytobacillus depressus]